MVYGITCLWTEEGWLYLAVMIDLYSRKVIDMGHVGADESYLGMRCAESGLMAAKESQRRYCALGSW